jgi:hypothetical protein
MAQKAPGFYAGVFPFATKLSPSLPWLTRASPFLPVGAVSLADSGDRRGGTWGLLNAAGYFLLPDLWNRWMVLRVSSVK